MENFLELKFESENTEVLVETLLSPVSLFLLMPRKIVLAELRLVFSVSVEPLWFNNIAVFL